MEAENEASWEAATWTGRPSGRLSGSEGVNAVRPEGRGAQGSKRSSKTGAKAQLWIIPCLHVRGSSRSSARRGVGTLSEIAIWPGVRQKASLNLYS
jgi:hypothetical protein